MNQQQNPHGAPPPYSPHGIQPPTPPGDGKATGALVCGLLGFFLGLIPAAIVGIVLAAGARKEGYTGSKATIGLVLSIISLVAWLAFWIACIACFVIFPDIIDEIMHEASYFW